MIKRILELLIRKRKQPEQTQLNVHKSTNRTGSTGNAFPDTQKIDEQLTQLWYSTAEDKWISALERYWQFVRPENLALEKRMESIDTNRIKEMTAMQFYNFLHDEYFVWKYTAKNRLATTRIQLGKYIKEGKLHELNEIKEQLFSFDLNDVGKGLQIASSIKGLGIAGASGLLSILFPEYFGTVDQFVVKALNSIRDIPEKATLACINPNSIKIKDGIFLIQLMKSKAAQLNHENNTNRWTPRAIDKILWTYGR